MNQTEYAAKMLSFYDGDDHVENVRLVPEVETIVRTHFPTLLTAFVAMEQAAYERNYYKLYTLDEEEKNRYVAITIYSDGAFNITAVAVVDSITDRLKELLIDYLVQLPEYRLLHATGLLHVEK